MLPVVVIAGRPNVGKSTLFNRLAGRRGGLVADTPRGTPDSKEAEGGLRGPAGRRAALVADTPGVTRDSKEAEAMLRGRLVRLVDTAGLEESAPETLAGRMRAAS